MASLHGALYLDTGSKCVVVFTNIIRRNDFFQDRAVCVSVLEGMGFRVGQGLIER